MSQRDRIIEIAIGELGYKEGYNNDTKYGEWYGMNNQPWCAMFVSWCAAQACLSDIIPKFASCTVGYRTFESMGESTRNHITPKKGDIIFFKWQEDGTPDHVGLVEYVENGRVHTIEGNRADKVARWDYDLNSSQIYGYSLPAYDDDPTPVPGKVETKEDVINYISSRYCFDKDWVARDTFNAMIQAFQVDTGCEVDGIIGNETKTAMKNNIVREGMSGALAELVQCALIMNNHPVSGFGMIDTDSGNEIANFQREKGLEDDRIVGINTWQKLLTK